MDDEERTPAGLTRREAARLLGGAALALASGLALPGGAGAFRRWCRVDPVFQIGDQTVHVGVAVAADNMRQARDLAAGATKLVLAVPAGVEVRHVASDDGFGYGYEVAVEEAADLDGTGPVLPVRVAVTVPMATSTVGARAEFVPRRETQGRLRPGSGEGTANAEIAFLAA